MCNMKYKILDIFCGAGGFSSGLDSLPQFETVIGVDNNSQAIDTFNKNFNNRGIVADITNDKSKKAIITKAKELNVNMIIGGPPCQGFSLKGKNLGLDDPRNFLFLEFLYFVENISPELVIIENVKNMINACGGYFISQIENKLIKLGYFVNWGILNAKHFGIPQSRERAFVICSKSKTLDLPTPTCNDFLTVRDAISDLSYLNSGEGCKISNYELNPLTEYQRRLRDNNNILLDHIATNHSKVALDKLKMIPPEGDKSSLPIELHGKQKFTTTWSRLIWDKPSPTIDTRFDTPSNGRNSHPYLHRAITPREAARIQSFNDSFVFKGSKVAICKQIGNAVPPLLARAIGESITSSFKTISIATEKYELINGDAYLLADELKQRNVTVDHIITDPPYNISRDNNFHTLKSPRKGVDFGSWDKSFDLYSWIPQYEKILNKNGSMIVFCSYLYISHIIDKLNTSGMVVKDIIIWQKSNPMPRNRDRRYVQDMEFAVWAVKKNARWVFNRDDKPYLRSLYTTPLVSGKEKNGHPTQKSLKLMQEIIKVHTNKSELILDPFMGSGSTGVASLLEGRRFLGVEIDSKFYDICKNRIQGEK